MQIHCDESGNTGVDLLNADQPLFALASTSLDASTCQSLIAPLLRQGQREAKYSRLKGTASGQRALIQLFGSDLISSENTKLHLADKRFYAVAQLVDKLMEVPIHEGGIDLYKGDGQVALAHLWYYTGRMLLPDDHWELVLKAFVVAIRQRSTAAYAEYDRIITCAAMATRPENRDIVTGLLLTRGRLDELLAPFDKMEAFDPAVDMFIAMANAWMAQHPGMFNVTHDRSKPLKRSEEFLRTMMKPLPKRMIGYGNRQAELPLRVSQFDFGDSVDHPQLQLADLAAGAAIDCVLSWTGRRPSSEYHERMKSTKLEGLIVGGVFPAPKFDRTNEPEPGQVNLVDGAAQFMHEAAQMTPAGDST